MNFNIFDFASNYNLFYSITKSFYGALGMYFFTIAFVFVIAFSITGSTIGRLPSYKGKRKLMSIILTILTAIFAELFYSFLDFFKTPLAWLYKYWWTLIIALFVVLIISTIVSFIIENKKGKYQKK